MDNILQRRAVATVLRAMDIRPELPLVSAVLACSGAVEVYELLSPRLPSGVDIDTCTWVLCGVAGIQKPPVL